MQHPILALVVAVLSAALAACATQPSATLQNVKVGEDQFLATDARLRIIVNSEIGEFSRPGLVDPLRLVCTEPSPDVAIAVANSFGAGLSVLGEGSGSISGEAVEGLGQLVERTASIQLLRDKMYQTCLAYANGAISGTTYSLIMSRLDDTIVTLLLGETAGGAFGRAGASIDSAASAEANASLVSLPAAVSDVEEANAEVAEKQKAVDEAQRKLDEAKAAVPAGEEPNEEQKENITALEKGRNDAQSELTAALSLLQGRIDTAAAAAGKATGTGIGGLVRELDPQVADTLGEMQGEFLNADAADRYVSACITELALQTELRTDTTAQTIAALVDRIKLAKAQKAQAQTTDPNADVHSLDSQIGEDQATLNEYVATLTDPESDLALTGLYKNFQEYWLKGAQSGANTINNARYISAAYTVRTSALANFCKSWLEKFTYEAKDDSQEFRMRRLALEVEVEKVEAEARLSQAEADRLAGLQHIKPALDACEAALKSDPERKTKCIDVVLSGRTLAAAQFEEAWNLCAQRPANEQRKCLEEELRKAGLTITMTEPAGPTAPAPANPPSGTAGGTN